MRKVVSFLNKNRQMMNLQAVSVNSYFVTHKTVKLQHGKNMQSWRECEAYISHTSLSNLLARIGEKRAEIFFLSQVKVRL